MLPSTTEGGVRFLTTEQIYDFCNYTIVLARKFKKLVQCQAVLLLGLRKPHKYIRVALVGIHANEVFSNPKAARPLKFTACSVIDKLVSMIFFVGCTANSKGIGTVKVYETSLAWMPSYRGEASDYKAQLCAQLNDTQLC